MISHGVNEKEDILNIHEYLMEKNIKQDFVALLNFSAPVTAKFISLNEE